MQNMPINQAKKLAKIYYQDKIWQLAKSGKSIRDISDYINKSCIPRSKLKGVTLSKTTIHTIIKKAQND